MILTIVITVKILLCRVVISTRDSVNSTQTSGLVNLLGTHSPVLHLRFSRFVPQEYARRR